MAEKETKPEETKEVVDKAPNTETAAEAAGEASGETAKSAPGDYLQYLENTYVRCGS